MGSMAWVAASPDLATHEALRARFMAGAEYAAKMQSSKGLFLPGSDRVVRSVKLA
jgi:hypothetical protein